MAMVENRENFWVFGYGSLMWRPDFPFQEADCGLVRGYHRDLCVLSTKYRGTREQPGLVVGLVGGGSCLGRAFRVAPGDVDDVVTYLHERELNSGVYEPRYVNVTLRDKRRTNAYAFVVRRHHPNYTGKIPLERKVELVLQGTGHRGSGLEYLENTVTHLDELGVPCDPLRAVLERARLANR